jgi:hypothetical protein
MWEITSDLKVEMVLMLRMVMKILLPMPKRRRW